MRWLGFRVETAATGSFCRCSNASPRIGSWMPRRTLTFGETAMNEEAGGVDWANVPLVAPTITQIATSAAFLTWLPPTSGPRVQAPAGIRRSASTDSLGRKRYCDANMVELQDFLRLRKPYGRRMRRVSSGPVFFAKSAKTLWN